MELLYAQLSGLEQTQAEVLCLLKTRQRICLKEHQVWCARNEDAQESKAPDQHHNPLLVRLSSSDKRAPHRQCIQ